MTEAGDRAGDGLVRVVIADDVEDIRVLLNRAFETNGGLTVVGEAGDSAAAVAEAARTQPDIVVIDRSMPGPSPLTIVGQLREAAPSAAIVLLTATSEKQVEPDLVAAVDRCLEKATPLAELVGALLEVGRAGRLA